MNNIYPVLGNLHDAVLMWAYAVNKTLEEGGSEDDGISITKNIINSTFEGVTGKVKFYAERSKKLSCLFSSNYAVISHIFSLFLFYLSFTLYGKFIIKPFYVFIFDGKAL